MDDQFIESLDYISKQLNRYLAIIIFIFGIVGNTLNCFILSQRTLRSNPCALLFLASSFIDLISILAGLTTRILAGWELDPTTTNTTICKLRAFVVFSTRTMAIWLITLATIDRWSLSSMNFHRRQMSTLKNATKGIIVTVIISAILYSHMLYCYQSNLPDTPLKCYGKSRECRFTTDIIYSLITVLIPSIIMILFGLMIISNIRFLRMRFESITIISIMLPAKVKQIKLKKTDRQLLRMLLVQVILLIIFCIPQAIQKFYITFKSFGTISKRENAINHFFYNIEVLLAFVASGMPFYLYTLTGGTIFRRASLDFIGTLQQKFTYPVQSFNESIIEFLRKWKS